MVTIECKAPCPFGIGAPSGVHYHHYHNVNEPDCIIDRARELFGYTKYSYSKEEYNGLRQLAQKLRLSCDLISELDDGYANSHRLCFYDQMKKGSMNSMVGMGWDMSIQQYYDAASSIEMARGFVQKTLQS